jgi:uncharacterized protein (TIGR02646 family)
MRPVDRGASPIIGDFKRYGDAYPFLVAQLEKYCSYCERYLATGLAVEHIQPKKPYPALERTWDNFLLGCVNCNSTKGDQDVLLHDLLLPDRDNTFAAYEYTDDGQVRPAPRLDAATHVLAERTLTLTGQNTSRPLPNDPNLRRIAIDRINQRRELWLKALRARYLLESSPSQALREVIVELARAEGFFSIWMKVFEADTDMRRRFIAAFVGTASDCFDPATTVPVSPRPGNGLAHCGKS